MQLRESLALSKLSTISICKEKLTVAVFHGHETPKKRNNSEYPGQINSGVGKTALGMMSNQTGSSTNGGL